MIELTGEGVQQRVEENLKSLAVDQSEGADARSHDLTCAVVREVMFTMKASLAALGKRATQCSRRGAEHMIHQVTKAINTCLASHKAQQKSAPTPESWSLGTDVASTTGEVMAVIIQTMESHLDDPNEHPKDDLSTVAATVKIMETQSAAMEHPPPRMDICLAEGQSQTQKGVRCSSRHTTQSIDKLSDIEFQEKARNAVSDVLSKRLPGSTTQLSRPSSTVAEQIPSVSVADLAASTITDMFVEEVMFLVESTDSFTELSEQESVEPTRGKKDVQSAALELFQKMKDKVMDIFNKPRPESLEEGASEVSVTDQAEDVESCTKEIVSKIVVLYKSVSENEDANSLVVDSRTSRESLVKMNFVDNVFAQLKNLTYTLKNTQVDSSKKLESSSPFATNSEECLHTLSDKSFQTEAVQAVSDVLKKSVTTLLTLIVPEISASATNQDSEVAAYEIVGSFIHEVGSFAQLIQGPESVEVSDNPPEAKAPADECPITDDQRTTAAQNAYKKIRSGVKKYFIGNTVFQIKGKEPAEVESTPQDEGVPGETSSSPDALNEANLVAVDTCTKSVIGKIIGVFKSKASEEDTEQPIQDVGGIMSELEGMTHSTEAPQSVPHSSKSISTRSSASSIQHLSATLQKLSNEKTLNQVMKQVSEALLQSVQGRTGSDTSVHDNGSVSLSEAELTALDVTDTVVKGVEILLECPEILEMTNQEADIAEPEKRKPFWSIFQNVQDKVKDFVSKHRDPDFKVDQLDTTETLEPEPASIQDQQPDSDNSTKKEVQLLKDLAPVIFDVPTIQTGERLVSSEPRTPPPSQQPSISMPSTSKESDALPGFLPEEKILSFSKDLTYHIKSLLLDSNAGPQIIKLIAGKSTSDSVLYMKENKHAQKKKHAALEMVYVFAEEAIRCMLQPYFRLPSKLNTDEEFPTRPVYSEVIDVFTRVMVCQVMDNLGTIVEQGGSVGSDEVLASSRPPSSKSGCEPCLSDAIIRDPQLLEENTNKATGSSLPELDSDDYTCLVTILILRLLAKIRDQELVSADLMEATKDLIERVLSEFTDAPGIQKSSSHPQQAKVKRVYTVIYDYLMKEFGTTTAIKTIATEDLSFDQLLITTLTRELLHTCDIQDPTTRKTPQSGKIPKLRINLKVRI